jgi:NADP-dependent 3-hydroxy acid dehydrogenase YdfG
MPLSFMAELRVDDWNRMIDVNLRGVLNGIAAVLLINVASVSAHRVDPTAAVYCATKYAVRALSEGLRQASKDLRVTVVSPGLTRTELFEGIGSPEVRAATQNMLEQSSIPASAIAQAIGFAISQPENVDVNELIVRPPRRGEPHDRGNRSDDLQALGLQLCGIRRRQSRYRRMAEASAGFPVEADRRAR